MTAYVIKEDGSGNFTSINAFESNGSVISGDTATIEGTWAFDDATKNTWNKTLTIEATGSSRHSGIPWTTGDTHHRHRPTSGHSFDVRGNVTFIGLDLQSSSTTTSDEIFRCGNTSDYNVTATDCLIGFDTAGGSSEQDMVYKDKMGASNVFTFTNCFIYNMGRNVFDIYKSGATNGGTIDIILNSCTFYDIGSSTQPRATGSIVGIESTVAVTVNVDAHNCIFGENSGNGTRFLFASTSTTPTIALNVDKSIVNDASTKFNDADWDTVNVDCEYDASIVSTLTGTGLEVGLTSLTSPYDPHLIDNDTDNDAQTAHTTTTGTNSGIAITAQDYVDGDRDITSYDYGCHAITLDTGGGGGLSVPVALYSYRQRRNHNFG